VKLNFALITYVKV